MEKDVYITNEDLHRLLNEILKLDRLQRLVENLPSIKTYLRLHPINKIDGIKTLQLECKMVENKDKNQTLKILLFRFSRFESQRFEIFTRFSSDQRDLVQTICCVTVERFDSTADRRKSRRRK